MSSNFNPLTLPNFFVLEGLDGSGKTTLLGELKKRLPNACFDTEPTCTGLGKQIRELIKTSNEALQDETLLLLFTADRWEHIFGKNGVAHKNPKQILFCDRYFFSTLAYQGNSISTSAYAKSLSLSFPLPQIVFYLDIDPRISLERVRERKEETSHYENLERLTLLRKNYEKVFLDFQKDHNLRIIKLDARLTREELADQVLEILKDF